MTSHFYNQNGLCPQYSYCIAIVSNYTTIGISRHCIRGGPVLLVMAHFYPMRGPLHPNLAHFSSQKFQWVFIELVSLLNLHSTWVHSGLGGICDGPHFIVIRPRYRVNLIFMFEGPLLYSPLSPIYTTLI